MENSRNGTFFDKKTVFSSKMFDYFALPYTYHAEIWPKGKKRELFLQRRISYFE